LDANLNKSVNIALNGDHLLPTQSLAQYGREASLACGYFQPTFWLLW